MQAKSITIIATVTGLILLIPLVAMQFTSEVNWTLFDFLVMGTMLFVTGLLIDFTFRKAGKYKMIAIAGIVIAFLWLWVELAVGLFTTWGS